MDNKEIQKQNFLTTLAAMDKDQINQFIKEHGKGPKRVRPLIKLNKEE